MDDREGRRRTETLSRARGLAALVRDAVEHGSRAVEKVHLEIARRPFTVLEHVPGIEAPNLTGGMSKMLPNHHITKPVFIGEVRGDGQFDVVWKTPGLVPGDAWSKHLDGSKDLTADWVKLKCGNYNTKTKKCGGV